MGLFKDFKEDFSQAVNEMMPGSDVPEKEEKAEDLVVNTLGEDVDVKSELSKLDGLLEQVKSEPEEVKPLERELPPVEGKTAAENQHFCRFWQERESRTGAQSVFLENRPQAAAQHFENTAGTSPRRIRCWKSCP